MTLAERLATGLSVTVLGMGLVFVLLVLLWALLTVMLRLDRPPAREAGEGAAPARPDARRPVKLPPELLAAVTVAVFTHQAVLRKQAAPAMRSHWPGSILFASRWVAAGRHQQTQNWHPRGR
jgi:Na+-transporting methylmalonyl-CoA/oxaloacetate decarboxylase gamma subunit